MNSLPKVNLPYDGFISKTMCFYSPDVNKESYETLENLIKGYVGSDCWAVVVDDEILFNNYDRIGMRDKIINNQIRDKIIENPHTNLLVNLLRNKKDSLIRIYLFGSQSWTLNIEYKNDYKVFELSFYKS